MIDDLCNPRYSERGANTNGTDHHSYCTHTYCSFYRPMNDRVHVSTVFLLDYQMLVYNHAFSHFT